MNTYQAKELEKVVSNGIVKGCFKCTGITLGITGAALAGLFSLAYLGNLYDKNRKETEKD